MACPGCTSEHGGVYIADCRQCALREIVNGPEFFAALRAGKITPAYAARLSALGDVENVHAEVKALAKTMMMGATPA